MYSGERSLRENRAPNRRKTPSFSSSLLDAIYRSIDDESNDQDGFETRKKQSFTCAYNADEEIMNLRRAIMIEKRMESRKLRATTTNTWSSSDSSSAGAFSSSENEESTYYYHRERARSVSSCFTPRRPKPVRTGSEPERQNGFTKTKLRALKIYGELKAKRHIHNPISPGRRISNFLNSIFTPKKENNHFINNTTTCSSKTPSSVTGGKRSVRFCPVSVILDDQKKKFSRGEKIVEIREEIKNYKSFPKGNNFQFRDENEDDDDAESYASSDLFELENLIGIGRYREELPVYETTSLKKNQAIASGFIV